jgi:hypothetical protein
METAEYAGAGERCPDNGQGNRFFSPRMLQECGICSFRESDSYSGLLAKLRARLKCEFVDFGERECVAFRNELDRPHVENWLLRRLIKDSEGLMSRHLERRISLAVTRNLVDTRITPNAMTLISVGIGLAGAFFFALPQRSYPVVAPFFSGFIRCSMAATENWPA